MAINRLTTLYVDTLVLLFISMILVAAFFYLPAHVAEMLRRAWFYYAGDETVSTVGVGSKGVGVGSDNTGAHKHGIPGGLMPGPGMGGQHVVQRPGEL